MEIPTSLKDSAENHDDTTTLDSTENKDETDDATTSKDVSANPEYDHISLKAMEVNSADHIRQAIKAVLSTKVAQKRNEDTEPATIDRKADTITQEYKPESGDQLHSPTKKTRKRRGRPQKAGPSKRVKKSRGHNFFIGKLSNVARRSRGCDSHSESDSDASVYTRYSCDPNDRYRLELRYSK